MRIRTSRCVVVLVACCVVVGGPLDPASGSASASAPAPAAMTAMFARSSYQPGQLARLRVLSDARRITVRPLSVLPRPGHHRGSVFNGAPVGPARTLRWHGGAGSIEVRIGDWPSGVYFERVRSVQGVVVAPIVVRPPHLGRAAVAVVIPTYTWQAYNRRDGHSWYVCSCVHTVDLSRPYLDRGVPYNFGQYDREFLEWLARAHEKVDVLADADLDQIPNGAELRHQYRMVVFEGHGEYVTRHMYDIAQQYRDRGGHLAFLSANQFFRDVDVRGDTMTLVGRWRDLGRPEAALMGSQYIDWYRNIYPNRPYRVTGARRVPWLFADTGLHDGSEIAGRYGIEIDGLTRSSPGGTVVVADIPDIFPGESAQMTYYATAAGAEVFNAGTIDFGGNASRREVSRLLRNLWAHMAAGARAQSGR